MEKTCYTCKWNLCHLKFDECVGKNYAKWQPSEVKPKGYSYIPSEEVRKEKLLKNKR